jgi:uncharacterized protein (DUF305 family)
MYAMVDTFANIIPNINQAYMAGLMTAPMILIEILLMGHMYKNKRLNGIILVFGAVLLISSFLLIRNQTAIDDKEFLKSMIPHHAGAILMVKEANISDPEVKKLANDIIVSQQKEIDFMKAKIIELQNRK